MKIPQYFSHELPQVANVSPQIAAMPYEARAQFGGAVADLGQKILEGKKKVDQALAVQGGLDEYRIRMTDLDSVLKKTGDPDYLSKMQAGSEKAMAEIFGRTKDPEVLSHLKIKLSDVSTDTYLKAKNYDNAKFLSSRVGDAKVKLYELSKLIGEATSDEERIKLGAEGIELINGIAPMLGKEEAANWKIAFDKENVSALEKANFNAAAYEVEKVTKIEQAHEIIKKYKIPKDDSFRLLKRADDVIEKNKTLEENATVDNAYAVLKDKYGPVTVEGVTVRQPDFEAMLEKARDPAFQKEQNLTGTRAHKLQILLTGEKATLEYNKNKIYEKTSIDFFARFGQGKLSIKDVNQAVVQGTLDWKTGEHWRNTILNPPDTKTDPATYLSILKTIEQGTKDKSQVQLDILKSGNLSREDKKSLGGRLYKEEDKENDIWMKKGEKYLEDMIIPKRGMEAQFRTTFKEEKDNYDALQTFHTTIDKAKASGKPLTGQDILNKAKEIAPTYMKSLPERMTEYAEEMKKVGSEMKNITEIKKKAEKYKTKEDVIADYNNNKITYDESASILRVKFGVK